MDSLVLELQKLATSSSEPISDVLRKALVVAAKLKLNDFREWVECELNGYQRSEVPDYRKCRADYFYRNPHHGLQPIIMPSTAAQKFFCDIRLTESAGSLEDVLDRGKRDKGTLSFPIPPEMEAELRDSCDLMGMPLYRLVSPNAITAVLDSIRTAVLEWALRLEAEGILGEGMTFSKAEQEKAQREQSIKPLR